MGTILPNSGVVALDVEFVPDVVVELVELVNPTVDIGLSEDRPRPE